MTKRESQEIDEDFWACAASTTQDLLDCDCGYMTSHMKIQLLTLRDDHTLYTLDKQFSD